MWQASLFDENFSARMVNVASVPQLSLFRYPGGKTWFVPYIRQWLSPLIRQRHNLTPIYPGHFIEPFLGGGSISLTVASENLAAHTLMVELDMDVAAVWQTVLNVEDGEWLAREILTYNLTLENVELLLDEIPATVPRRAFQTIVRNRVNRGGILAPGAGLLKSGENGKGIKSRWYPQTLAKRIHRITSLQARVTFIAGDGLEVLATHVGDPNAVFFIDPPYTAGKNGKRAGERLYRHNELDHDRLFELASHIQGDFLMTYDNSDEVHGLATKYNLDTRLLPMSNTHHTKMMEVLIGRNLDWVQIPEPELLPEEIDTQIRVLAESNPPAAIVRAWSLVEEAGAALLTHVQLQHTQNGHRWPRKISKSAIRLLHQHTHIDDELFASLMRLMETRNTISHRAGRADATIAITEQDAVSYLDLARETVQRLTPHD